MSAAPKIVAAALGLSALAGAARADFTVTGEVRYVDRTFTFGGGFNGVEPQVPVRRARVQMVAVAGDTVLATAATQDDGTFSFVVPGAGTQDVFLRVRSVCETFGTRFLRVTDNSDQLYDLVSPTFNGWDMSSDLDVGLLVSTKMTLVGKVGNPFNLLDQMVHAMDYITGLGASNATAHLRLTWPGGSGSFASGNSAWIADDDGYDDMVILHEFGHVVHNHWSDSDSTGGSHTFSDSDQDPRLSLGEGFASFFAGAVRQSTGVFDPGFYMDCNGSGGTGGIQLRMRMENGSPFGSSTGGEADEGAVMCSLWDIVDTTATNDGGVNDDDLIDGSFTFTGGIDGNQLVWNALVGPVNSAPNLTIRDFWNAFSVPVDSGQSPAIADTFRTWSMRFFADPAEPDNSLSEASSVAPGTSWGGLRTLYWSANDPPVPGEGDLDFYTFELCAGDAFDVETRYYDGVGDAETYVDPFITLRRPDDSFVSSADDGGTGRNAKISAVANVSGLWSAEVRTVHSYRRTGSYQFRVRITTPAPGLCACCPLNADVGVVSLGAGGSQAMTLDAGTVHASKIYWVFGSVTGTTPGLPTDLGTLPLNFDSYFLYTLSNPNLAPLANSLNVLDGNGRGNAAFSLPAGSDPGLVGATFNHAYLVFGFDGIAFVLDFVSNAVPVIAIF